jgi:hypothetical protein
MAVPIHHRPCLKVLWAFLLQLPGNIPVIYGIYQVTRD